MLKHSLAFCAALLTPIAFIAAEHEFSGLIDFVIDQPLFQKEGIASGLPLDKELSSKALISKARLRFDVRMAKHWYAHLQAQLPEYDNAQLGLPLFDDVFRTSGGFDISQAYASYQWSENLDFRFGHIPLTALSITQMGYQSPIGDPFFYRTAGTLYCAAGSHAGVGSSAVIGPVRFDMSVWQQSLNRRLWDLPKLHQSIPSTEEVTSLDEFTSLIGTPEYGFTRGNFRGNNMTLSYAARLALLYNTRPQTQWALGIGYGLQQLNMPIVVATLGSYDRTEEGGDYQPPNYEMTSYNRLVSVALDATRAYRWWLFQVGYQYQRLRADNSQHYYYENDADPITAPNLAPENPNSAAQSSALKNNGLAHSWWLQLGVLLYGDRYLMDIKDGSVAGLQTSPRYGALELYARVAIAHRHNALALLTPTAEDNMSADNLDPPHIVTPGLMSRKVVNAGMTGQYLLVAVDNTGAQNNTTVLQPENDIAYRSHEHAYIIGASLALSLQTQFKLEYELVKNSFKKEKSGSWQSDLFRAKSGILRLRWETMF